MCGRVVYCLVGRHNVLVCGIMAVYGGVLCGRLCAVWYGCIICGRVVYCVVGWCTVWYGGVRRCTVW